jgi:hypothetical protein
MDSDFGFKAVLKSDFEKFVWKNSAKDKGMGAEALTKALDDDLLTKAEF